MDSDFERMLEEFYTALERRQQEITDELSRAGFHLSVGFYNDHYHKDGAGAWVREAHPIPVIDVKGLCDVEIHFGNTAVSSKMTRAAALAYSFEPFAGREFEAYGVEDYLADYYHAGQSIAQMKANIRACTEAEIGFSFTLPADADGAGVLKLVKLLAREGFFY